MVTVSDVKVISYVDEVMARLTAKLSDGMNRAVDRLLNETEKTVKHSGHLKGHTLKDLARKGHPYAKRHGKNLGPYAPLGVHKRDRNIIDDIRAQYATQKGDWLTAAVYMGRGNTVADAVHGVKDSRMVPRPFLTGQIARKGEWEIYRGLLVSDAQ